ncbi:hypothetical protein QBC42DRAFT_72773 [Cladorrhinum samala]|uniref:Uncharacterized protein n=1 Tax=Cladorrhinum samala TaxID=585594 RepID=A0AAV9HQ17_9PEZI|nr:hypothetical protein QBC42DRAFT_72773 [Cladorrhinum samala]
MPDLREFLKKHKQRRIDTLVVPPPIPSIPPAVPQDSWQPTNPQTSSSFFALLPFEIRHQILREAFGDRTVHIDLRVRCASPKSSKAWLPWKISLQSDSSQEPQRHGRHPGKTYNRYQAERNPEFYFKDHGRPTWKWYSCICHNVVPPDLASSFSYEDDMILESDLGDSCLGGRANCSGSDAAECHLGAMGFLRSCKRGYTELSEILYATNAIILDGKEMIIGLMRQYALVPGAPRLIGPGLATVTALTLSMKHCILWGPESGFDRFDAEERREFSEALELLPRAFPRLAKLEVRFSHRMYYIETPRPGVNIAEVKEILLEPLLKMGKRLDALQNFSVSVPAGVWAQFREIVHGETIFPPIGRYYWGAQVKSEETGFKSERTPRIWYPFDHEAQQYAGRLGNGGFWVKVDLHEDQVQWYPGGRLWVPSAPLH